MHTQTKFVAYRNETEKWKRQKTNKTNTQTHFDILLRQRQRRRRPITDRKILTEFTSNVVSWSILKLMKSKTEKRKKRRKSWFRIQHLFIVGYFWFVCPIYLFAFCRLCGARTHTHIYWSTNDITRNRWWWQRRRRRAKRGQNGRRSSTSNRLPQRLFFYFSVFRLTFLWSEYIFGLSGAERGNNTRWKINAAPIHSPLYIFDGYRHTYWNWKSRCQEKEDTSSAHAIRLMNLVLYSRPPCSWRQRCRHISRRINTHTHTHKHRSITNGIMVQNFIQMCTYY